MKTNSNPSGKLTDVRYASDAFARFLPLPRYQRSAWRKRFFESDPEGRGFTVVLAFMGHDSKLHTTFIRCISASSGCIHGSSFNIIIGHRLLISLWSPSPRDAVLLSRQRCCYFWTLVFNISHPIISSVVRVLSNPGRRLRFGTLRLIPGPSVAESEHILELSIPGRLRCLGCDISNIAIGMGQRSLPNRKITIRHVRISRRLFQRCFSYFLLRRALFVINTSFYWKFAHVWLIFFFAKIWPVSIALQSMISQRSLFAIPVQYRIFRQWPFELFKSLPSYTTSAWSVYSRAASF